MRLSHYLLLPLLWLLLFPGCRHFEANTAEPEPVKLMMPKWSFLSKVSTDFVPDQAEVPVSAYVFPAVRLGTDGKPIDELISRVDADGKLFWISPASLGGELQQTVANKLRSLGFRMVEFSALMETPIDHSVIVFNIYYTESIPSQDNLNADPLSSWTTFVRITAATFPLSLDPSAKRELMNQEVVTLFNNRALGGDVCKRGSSYLLENVGINRQWSEMIHLLD